MLSPDDRTLLVDLLAPPDAGFRLERAVATTFTLHLTALLPIPLGLAGADLSSSTDPLSILQAIRNYSDRIDIFCQAGHVSVPSQHNDLFAFLEPMVHQVKAPSPGHLFHPKLWVLRFANDDREERYRLVCGSRNLTHDRAWDVVISLEGRRTPRPHAVNRPIADLLTSLAARVPAGVAADRRGAIAELAKGVRFVEWERPDNVIPGRDWLAFHLFGPSRAAAPNMQGYRRLVVSPFLNDTGLDAAWPDGAGVCVLLSRGEELNALGDHLRDSLEQNADLRVLDETAAIPNPDSDEAGLRWSLSGLHAKLYIVERNKEAHVFLGSANATDAAWGGNDELLVEIVGRVGTYGVEATLGESTGFGRILLPHTLGDAVTETAEDELRRTFENALRELSALTYTATVEGEREHPLLWVRSDEPLRAAGSLPRETELTVELLTITGQRHRLALGVRLDQRWQLSEVEEITPFLVMRLASGKGAARVEVSSVVLARLVGDPADRLDRVLARRIGNTSEFLRFILLLLQLAGREGWFPEGQGAGAFGAFGRWEGGGSGVLEAVLIALASSPATIDDIDRLVKQISATEQGRRVLPDGWDAFWLSVVGARSRLGTKP
ncbi:MAG TPA: phospholipase D family protein [Candidatus Dormibacteraeota bacterium]|nr:phospholipase D family protein [Candidatus Dormibacteraeota bacterium]HVC22924.1 phospholipase D family protein [Candidatus Dormibacteraeota bacterium]